MNRPLNGTIEFRIEIGKFISVPRIMEAVEGLIKFHEDRIKELEKIIGEGYHQGTVSLIISNEYESIKAIKHWLEDAI